MTAALGALSVTLAILVVVLWLALWSRSRITPAKPVALDPQDCASPGFPRMLAHLTLGSCSEGNQATLLENGDGFWPVVFEEITRATDSVHFETFLWETGALSRQLVDRLIESAERGVEVRMVLDAEGGKRMSDDERARLEGSPVDLRFYRPRELIHLGSYNGRDHRKLLIVDGRVAFVGGHCVTDEWLGDAQDRDHFRDMSVRLEGPVVAQVQATFSENWTEVSGRLLAGTRYFPELEPVGESAMHVAYLAAERRVSAVKTLYLIAIEAAQRSVTIMNPYFVPDPAAMKALERAVARGVQVRVMVPTFESTDSTVVLRAMMRVMPRLLDAGVVIYGYRRTLLHQKVITVDGRWSIVGSTNFDARSFDINDEVSVSIFDAELAARLSAAFDADLAHCFRYTRETVEERPPRARLLDRLAWSLREQL